MAKARYVARSGSVALAAATAKTALFVMAPSSFGVDLVKWSIEFDGVTASNVPVLCEICSLTGASNVTPGTGNTTVTVTQVLGRSVTAGFTSGAAATSEPTVLASIEDHWLTPNGGVLVYDYPLGTSPDSAVSNGFAIRLTAPAVVNARVNMWVERC